MPVYNEATCIETVINLWLNVIKDYPGSEMLVINDGSTDDTKSKLDILKKRCSALQVVHKENEGHGKTVLEGYKRAVATEHNWIFQTDSDDQFDPEDFNKLWSQRFNSKFILGYRLKRKDPLHRLIISRLIFFANTLLFRVKIKDANIPYRLIEVGYLKRLLDVLPPDLFAPNIFLAVLAKKDGQNLINVPVRHKERATGKISIIRLRLLKVCLEGFKDLLLFRLQLPSLISKLKKDAP